ncbi:Calcium-activated chloride channel [Phytophthora infestans]|nr:Calcium-activated chloride channel [Phytophthora infestans]
MADQLSPARAAAAVTQALGEIGLPPTRKPPNSSLLSTGRTRPQVLISARRAPFTPGSYGRPWKSALGNQLQHAKNDKRVAEKKAETGATQPYTVIAIHEEAALQGSIKTDKLSSRGVFRLRTNQVIQNQISQLEQSRQHRKEGDAEVVVDSGTQPVIDPASIPTNNSEVKETNAQAPVPISKPPDPPVVPLLRRKQAHHRHQSQSPPLHQRTSGMAAILTPPKQSKTLFFQTAEEDHLEDCGATEPSTISTSFETDPEADNSTDENPTENRSSPTRKAALERRPSDEQGEDDSFRSTATPERIGKLSRQEDEFDFAILLKPSKYEENVDLPETLKPSAKGDLTSDRAVIVSRIRRTGLHVKRLLSLDGKQSLLKVRAPQRVLELGAERLRLRKQRRFDKVWMVFSCELRSSFADFDPVRRCVNFLDSEKQSIVHALLTASESDGGAGLNESCPVAARYVVQMYPLHKQDLALLKTRWVTFWKDSLLSSKHHHDQSLQSKSRCVVLRSVLQQPLDDVAQYFGERVAFYFAWMEMYTRWLVVPSVAGVILFGLQVHSHHLDHPAAPVYALFMALWTSAFIIAWRRRAAALAYHWGTWGYEDEEVTRPEFYGDHSKPQDDKDGEEEKPVERHYSYWKRLLKYSVTLPCVAGSIVAVVTLAYLAFSTRDRLEAESLETKREAAVIAEKVKATGTITLEELRALAQLGVRWDFWIYLLLTPILYGLLIPVLDAAFTRAARCLNSWENHRTESRYQSHLILKVFSFRFVHVFASLYYYAFAPHAQTSKDGETQAAKSDGMVRVAIQLASFMVTGQLWKNVMETLYPFVRRRLDARAKKRASNDQFNQSTVFNGINAAAGPRGPNRQGTTSAKLATEAMMSSNAVIHEQCVRLEQASDRAWEEAGLKHYDTFEDYTEMLVQFGYVSFFSLAFPLAPLLALLNNVLELRTDAFKICHTRQRPLARKASGIGVWLHVLQIMSVLAVLTNCFHLAYSTSLLERAFPSVTATQKVWIVFGIEHLLLVIKVWLACVVPFVPRDVSESLRRERELAKHDSARAMAARMLVEVGASDSADVKQASIRHRKVAN